MTLVIALNNPEESFVLVFSLSELPETGHFVSRQKELDTMHKTLSNGPGRRIVILHGLGGMGKTQLAVAYAKAHRKEYSAILWLNIQDEISLKQSYSRIAKRIRQEHPSAGQFSTITDKSQLDEVVAAVKRWQEHAQNTQWLMVFDNYDNPKLSSNASPSAVDINQFLPDSYHGSIIVTTRSSKVDIGQRIRLTKLEDLRDSLQILSHASCRENIMDGQLEYSIAEATLTLLRS